jgi:hypothetical protein
MPKSYGKTGFECNDLLSAAVGVAAVEVRFAQDGGRLNQSKISEVQMQVLRLR